MGRKCAVDHDLSSRSQCLGYLGAHAACNTVDGLAHAGPSCYLSHTLQQVLVLSANDLVTTKRFDLLNGIAPPHDIDRANTQMPGQLNDEPADSGARGRL